MVPAEPYFKTVLITTAQSYCFTVWFHYDDRCTKATWKTPLRSQKTKILIYCSRIARISTAILSISSFSLNAAYLCTFIGRNLQKLYIFLSYIYYVIKPCNQLNYIFVLVLKKQFINLYNKMDFLICIFFSWAWIFLVEIYCSFDGNSSSMNLREIFGCVH